MQTSQRPNSMPKSNVRARRKWRAELARAAKPNLGTCRWLAPVPPQPILLPVAHSEGAPGVAPEPVASKVAGSD